MEELNEATKNEQATPPSPQASNEEVKNVSLSVEQYNALIDKVAELEEMASSSNARGNISEGYDIDSLAREVENKISNPRSVQAQQQQQVNFEDMDNKQLAQYILGEMNKAAVPLLTEVQYVKMFVELDKCARDYDDFWDYEKQIYALAGDNPKLTIEQAYLIASGKNPKPKKGADGSKSDDVAKTKRTNLEISLGLPQRVSLGERPNGVAPGSTKENRVWTLKEAAEAAAAEVFKTKR